MLDDISWVYHFDGLNTFILAVTEPFLYATENYYCGKILYSTSCIGFKEKRTIDGQSYAKCCERMDGEDRVFLTDQDLVSFGLDAGIAQGGGSDANLSQLSKSCILKFESSKVFQDVYWDKFSTDCLKLISSVYGVQENKIRLTGGLHLFETPLSIAHDIDVVIPVDSKDQLQKIRHFVHNCPYENANEFGLTWPLRWLYREKIICPFFVYGKLPVPAMGLKLSGDVVDADLEIVNAEYNIFNMPIYQTTGGFGWLAVRATLMRGLLKEGNRIHVRGQRYRAVGGFLDGKELIVIVNPWKEIINFSNEILNTHCR